MTTWSDNNIFRVFFKDKTSGGVGSQFPKDLGHLFTQVCQRSETRFAACSCSRFNPSSARDGYELIIYIVANQAKSLIPGGGHGTAGTTGFRNGGAVSEVYLDVFNDTPEIMMAKMAFHELMHNKLRLDNRLHTDGGFGLARDTVDFEYCMAPWSGFNLNEENKRLMAEKLDDPVPQNFSL